MNFIQANAYESEFGQILKDTLNGLATVDTQVIFGKYRVDFLIREYQLVIEYDEEGHTHPLYRERDRKKEKVLIAQGYKVIRVKKKETIGKSLNKILNVLWKNHS